MSSATTALEISCAKPDCHWRGSPADAPGHTCPTPAAEAEVVEVEDDAVARGEATTIDADADPTERAEIEAWLLEHGNYDEQGIPQDEKTATIDARLVALTAEEQDEDEEPELDDATAEAAMEELEQAIEEGEYTPVGDDDGFDPLGGGPANVQPSSPRPWETVIAEALESQTAVKEYRWLVVWKPEDATREAELIGRGKVKTEAVVIAEDVASRGELSGEIAVEKTADVLKAAAEIEKKRELVEEEPAKTVEEPQEPASEPEPAEPKPDVQKAAEEAQAAATKPGAEPKGALFDASDFDREDLAIAKVDGFQIDRIALGFSGGVMLDRSEPADVALYNRVKMGQEVELWVTAKGSGTGAKPATNREGDLDVIVGKKELRIEGLRVLKPEELGQVESTEMIRAAARRALKAGVTPDAVEAAVTGVIAETIE